MIFSYYNRLNAAQKRIYRKSDQILAVVLPNAAELRPLIPVLSSALAEGDRVKTERLCRELAGGICQSLLAHALRVRVLAARPSASWGELHGLYVPAEGRASAVITVWMRTAQRRQVVAFRSFLRTVLHEICHHLDYEFFSLEESFHTQGFYKRESSLFHQLVPGIKRQKK
jgi:hypothetical protein